VDREGIEIHGPTFSLVYATPLLQHQAQLGLSPSLLGQTCLQSIFSTAVACSCDTASGCQYSSNLLLRCDRENNGYLVH